MAEIWLKPDPYASDIAWVSFDLQEHKTHNNAALVMDHKYIWLVVWVPIQHFISQVPEAEICYWNWAQQVSLSLAGLE